MKGKELLRVSVLGNLAVSRDGMRMQLPPSKKTRALLAYLAVTDRPHSRDRLCAMFWPVPDDPRAALRWSLTRLRPLIDEPDCRRIIADRESVGLDLDRATVDIQMIECIPGPDDLEVLVQHHEKLARIWGGSSVYVHRSQIPPERSDVSIREAQDFMVKSINDPLAFRG